MSTSLVPSSTVLSEPPATDIATATLSSLVPDGGLETEDDMLIAQVANMQDLVQYARIRWWVAGLIIDNFLSTADPAETGRTTRHKDIANTITYYCKLCADHCNAHLETRFTPGSFYVAYQAVQTAKRIPVDPNTQSVWHVYDVQRAANDSAEAAQVLDDLDTGTLSSRGLKDTTWLRSNGHRQTPLAEPMFWVDPVTSAVYLQIGDGPLEPCTAPSRAWSLMVRRLGAQPISALTN